MRKHFSRKPKSEFKDSLLEVRRVTRVMAGGKRFSFRASVVVGDMKGRVGLGVAKGSDFVSSVQKAKRLAERNVIKINLVDNRTIPYDMDVKFGAAHVRIKPTKKGHGIIAGGSCRVVLELVGIKDISAKILGRTKNKIANAKATIKALNEMNLVQRTEKENK